MPTLISKSLTFDDVLLEPRVSSVSRNQINLNTLGTKNIKLNIPILSAAMDRVTETAMAVSLGKLGGMGVIHRNNTPEQQADLVKKAKAKGVTVAAAVGPSDIERALILAKAGCDCVVVDTAHGQHLPSIKNALEIKKQTKLQIIYGNIATAEAARLLDFVDAIKVGIGPGSICTTRIVAGIGVPQLTAVMEVVEIARKKKIPVIADGGIKYSGDIVKALAAGASSVMLGSVLSGTDEAPGKLVNQGKLRFKEFRGMGSLGAMESNLSSDRYQQKNQTTKVPEGVEALVPYRGAVKDIIDQLTGGLKSGMGYIGATNISDMPKQARFVQITSAGLIESHPHSVLINKKAPNY